MTDYNNLPDFDSLPTVKGMPQGCAWGLFDKDGKKDHLGCLNLLTPAVVREAFKEARDGVSVSLNWGIGAIQKPAWGRKGLTHDLINFREPRQSQQGTWWGFDDELSFNSQSSSQWDSMVHYGHQQSGRGYNGCQASTEDLIRAGQGGQPMFPTLDHWHARGGLVGRGVLLDYRAYAEAKGIKYSCFDSHAITVHDLEAVAKYQGTNFKHGDVLIVRTGFTDDLAEKDSDEQHRLLSRGTLVGVAGTKETARWVWNHRFAAVAGDAIAFEVLPSTRTIEEENDDGVGNAGELVLHQYFLSLFGMHIGELWDLKALSVQCKKAGRCEFLLTSVPLNVPSLVGSPPNALAIF